MRARTSIVLLVLIASLVGGAAHVSAAPESEARFGDGVARFRSGQFSEALVAFEASYQLRPVPEVLFNIAHTLRKLGRYGDAADAFSRYVRDVEAKGGVVPAERAASIARLQDEIAAKRATLFLELSPADAQVTVDGRSVSREPNGDLRVDPGAHFLVVSSPRHRAQTVELMLEPGEHRPVKASLVAITPDPPRIATVYLAPRVSVARSPRGAAAIAIGTIGLAALVGAATSGGLAMRDRAAYDDGCRARTCDEAQYDAGRREAIATDVLIGAASVAAITTGTLLLVELGERRRAQRGRR